MANKYLQLKKKNHTRSIKYFKKKQKNLKLC